MTIELFLLSLPILFLKIYLFIFKIMCFVYVSECDYEQVSVWAKRGHQIGIYESPTGDTGTGLLKEQYMFLADEPSLQLPILYYLMCI